MKKAFNLLEVNLAMMIMASGVLVVVGLYALGYRETRHSREDTVATAYADAVLSRLTAALSSTNLTWSAFNQIKSSPSELGWQDYLDSRGFVSGNPDSKAKAAYDQVMSVVGSKAGVDVKWPSQSAAGLKAGLVVMREENSAVVRLAFRATRRADDLLATPIYYTEVRYQGVTEPLAEETKK